MTKNDIIGEGSFAITAVNSGGKSSQNVTISYKGKKAGEVMMDFEFFPDNKAAGATQQPQYGSVKRKK